MILRCMAVLCLAAFAKADGLACFQKLPVPGYPRLAQQATIGASVAVRIAPAKSGGDSPEITLVPARTLFTGPIHDALKKARIAPECAGRTVEVTFVFVVDRTLTPNDKHVPTVEIEGKDNRVMITTALAVMNFD